jgi:hypothetical protein
VLLRVRPYRPSLPARLAISQHARRLVRERLEWATAISADLDPAWAQQGETILLQLRGAVHAEIDPTQVNRLEPDVRQWQRYGRALERQAVVSGAPSLRHWLANSD